MSSSLLSLRQNAHHPQPSSSSTLNGGGGITNSSKQHQKYSLDEVIIFVLKVDESTIDAAQWANAIQQQVYQEFSNKRFPVKWLSEEEALAQQVPNRAWRYILPRFEGLVFEHLAKIKCRIIGSQLALRSLKEEFSIKNPFKRAIFSQNLCGAIVCFSGFTTKDKEAKSFLVEWMGGVVVANFIADVTHLVANFGSAQSTKFRTASKLKIPILGTKWIDEAWGMAHADELFDCTAPTFFDSFRVNTYAKKAPINGLSLHSLATGSVGQKENQNNHQQPSACFRQQQPILPRVGYRDKTELSSESFTRELVLSKGTANNRTLVEAQELHRWEEESDLQSSVSYSKKALNVLQMTTSFTGAKNPPRQGSILGLKRPNSTTVSSSVGQHSALMKKLSKGNISGVGGMGGSNGSILTPAARNPN